MFGWPRNRNVNDIYIYLRLAGLVYFAFMPHSTLLRFFSHSPKRRFFRIRDLAFLKVRIRDFSGKERQYSG